MKPDHKPTTAEINLGGMVAANVLISLTIVTFVLMLIATATAGITAEPIKIAFSDG